MMEKSFDHAHHALNKDLFVPCKLLISDWQGLPGIPYFPTLIARQS
jgi:hypothetical protein